MCQVLTPAHAPIPPVDQQAGHCPQCGEAELEYGGGELFDTQYAYEWTCEACGATGREWYALTFEEHVLTGAEPRPAGMKKFTIIGEYWDNEQGYCGQVEAEEEEEAIATAQRECAAGLVAGREPSEVAEEETEESGPLRIWAVLPGWVNPLFVKSAEG